MFAALGSLQIQLKEINFHTAAFALGVSTRGTLHGMVPYPSYGYVLKDSVNAKLLICIASDISKGWCNTVECRSAIFGVEACATVRADDVGRGIWLSSWEC